MVYSEYDPRKNLKKHSDQVNADSRGSMISYLELRTLGISIEPKNLGPPIDPNGKFHACGDLLEVKFYGNPKDKKRASALLEQALAQRSDLAKKVTGGGFRWLDTTRGQCDACGQDQENFRSGICLLCRAAVQRLRRKGDL